MTDTLAVSYSPIASALLLGSVLLSAAFVVYGLNTLYLTIRSKRYRQADAPTLAARPTVAIHLPIYNEFYVVRRLLASCTRAAQRYGSDLVRIYILDDSTDETSSEVDRLSLEYVSKGIRVCVVRRGSRTGFKAGALQAALEETEEKYVAVFDADFVPPEDFLERTVPLLENDSTVGFVQARWGHLDRDHSLMTKTIAIGIDAHFFLEQKGRNGNGYLMNFNGSAGVLRVSAIKEAGGWAPDTLAEDLDLSYRLQLRGYRGIYLNDVEVPGELPPTIAGLKRQQGRWARGSLQTAKKLIPSVNSSKKLSLKQKVEAGIHLTYYLVHPLMVASFLMAVMADFLSVDVIKYAINFSLPVLSGAPAADLVTLSFVFIPWLVFSVLVVLSTVAVLLYCVEAIRVQKLGLVANIEQILLLVILGYGISISNSVQALGGIFSKQTGSFSRTPKYAIESTGGTWNGKKYQPSLGRTTVLEAGAVALSIVALAYAWITSNVGIMPILIVYLVGYSCVLYLTVAQALASHGSRDA
ncbi:MAG: glycosyltransferase [Nitrososphaerota archaeon]|nr:glycosyltransferase [Nitrososphaerota archaeon]MDG6943044.1 glycosyltransferase [Nitrososphaerota archaeon]MDG6950773.1 glycosyltransferase [Nitrososphaerota archaeon]